MRLIKLMVFFSILMQIDKVVISYNYLHFKLPKKKNGPILTNAYYDDNL